MHQSARSVTPCLELYGEGGHSPLKRCRPTWLGIDEVDGSSPDGLLLAPSDRTRLVGKNYGLRTLPDLELMSMRLT